MFKNYLVFIPAKKHIKYFNGTTWVESWKSNGMSEENIENIAKYDSNFAPTFVDHNLLTDMTFNGLNLTKIYFYPKKGNKTICFLRTNSILKKFRYRFYIK